MDITYYLYCLNDKIQTKCFVQFKILQFALVILYNSYKRKRKRLQIDFLYYDKSYDIPATYPSRVKTLLCRELGGKGKNKINIL